MSATITCFFRSIPTLVKSILLKSSSSAFFSSPSFLLWCVFGVRDIAFPCSHSDLLMMLFCPPFLIISSACAGIIAGFPLACSDFFYMLLAVDDITCSSLLPILLAGFGSDSPILLRVFSPLLSLILSVFCLLFLCFYAHFLQFITLQRTSSIRLWLFCGKMGV